MIADSVVAISAEWADVEGDGTPCLNCGDPVWLKGKVMRIFASIVGETRDLGEAETKPRLILCGSCAEGL